MRSDARTGWRSSASRRWPSACCGRSSTRCTSARVGELIDERAAGRARHALAPAQPDRARVPARVLGRDRRVAEAADAARTSPRSPTTCGAAGFAGELLVATSFGGVLRLDDVADAADLLGPLGPALAPVAGRVYARRRGRRRDVIVCDTGGTSFDVSLIRDGDIKFTRETWLGGPFTGHLTGLSSVDVREHRRRRRLASPGSTRAGCCASGPQSAGADPGPACYGRGGTEPTVTDAALVLGYLDPEHFLGGRMRLDRRRGRGALAASSPTALGIGRRRRPPHAVLTIANEHMVGAIQRHHDQRGRRPARGRGRRRRRRRRADDRRRSPSELGCRDVLVPRTAGALSAPAAAQFSDIVAEFNVSQFADTSALRLRRGQRRRSQDARAEQTEEFAAGLRGEGISAMRTRVLRRGPLRLPGVGARGPARAGRFERAPTSCRRWSGLPPGARARVRGRASRAQRVECLNWKGAADARRWQAGARRALAGTIDERGRGAVAACHRVGVLRRRLATPTRRLHRRHARRRRPARRARDRRGADDARSSSTPAGRARVRPPWATTTWRSDDAVRDAGARSPGARRRRALRPVAAWRSRQPLRQRSSAR